MSWYILRGRLFSIIIAQVGLLRPLFYESNTITTTIDTYSSDHNNNNNNAYCDNKATLLKYLFFSATSFTFGKIKCAGVCEQAA